MNLGFAPNTSAYVLYIQKALMTSNQVKFDEHEFQFQKMMIFEQYLSDKSTDLLFKSASDVKWIIYKTHELGY
jgi:hypothetical protein